MSEGDRGMELKRGSDLGETETNETQPLLGGDKGKHEKKAPDASSARSIAEY